jgi:hypothetical protein
MKKNKHRATILQMTTPFNRKDLLTKNNQRAECNDSAAEKPDDREA